MGHHNRLVTIGIQARDSLMRELRRGAGAVIPAFAIGTACGALLAAASLGAAGMAATRAAELAAAGAAALYATRASASRILARSSAGRPG